MDEKTLQVCRTVLQFGRIWGIMETLGADDFPTLNTLQDSDFLIRWAEEYTAGEKTDIAEFFEKKIKTTKGQPSDRARLL